MFRQLQFIFLTTAVCFFSYNIQASAQVENDEPENAIALIIGTNGPFTNVEATPNVDDLAGGECGNNGTGDGWSDANVDNSVWFTYVGSGGEVILESGTGCGDDASNNDTQFALYEGAADGPLVICNDDISGASFYSAITFFAEENVTYFLLVDGWDGTVGEFCIEVNTVGCGNGVCESNETFENCLADCPCTPSASWAGNLGDFYLECTSENAITVPVGILGAGETDELYTVTTNIGTLSADTIETVTLTEIYITQSELDASDGQLVVTFEGIGFDGQCMDVLEADLIEQIGGDIAIFCEQCAISPGTISTVDSTTVCISDSIADIINVTAIDNDSENYTYIVTNENGSIFLAGPNTEGVFDFNNISAGVCQIWGIAYDGEITFPNPNDSLLIQGECYELSNSIEVVREECAEVGVINISGFENALRINKIGPIPGNNQLSLSFTLSNNTENTVISIFDFTGKKIEEINIGQGLSAYNKMNLDISQLATGMYILQLTDGHTIDTVRFIKK